MNVDEKMSIDDMMNQINWNEIGINGGIIAKRTMKNWN